MLPTAAAIYPWRPWLKAARPAAHGMIALPLLWGQALAIVHAQTFTWTWFLVAHLFGVLCQVFSLYLNDFADERLDRSNQTYWLSGGSRVIPDGQLLGQQLYRAAIGCIGLCLLLSVLSMFGGRELMPLIALVAIALGWGYSLPPVRASYRGHGELLQAVSCGLVLPLTGYYLQSDSIDAFPWFSLLPVGLVFFASNIVTALPDLSSDRQGNKRSFPVRYGVQQARRCVLMLSGIAGLLATPQIMGHLKDAWAAALVSGPTLVLLYIASLTPRSETIDPFASSEHFPDLKRFMAMTISSHAWLLLAWTVLLFWHGAQDY